jgi:glycosyltransferase involved in cell wall biosynthesis
MSSGKMLSVAVACSNPDTLDFPFRECLESVLPIADEIVVLNGDHPGEPSQVQKIVTDIYREYDVAHKFRLYTLPWQEHMRKNMEVLAKTAAISQCTGDYVLLLDADELIHEDDYKYIRGALDFGHDAYSFGTLHFYSSYRVIKKYDDHWYDYRPKLFKNGLGIWDGPQSWIEDNKWGADRLRTEYTADLVTWDYKPVHTFSKKLKVKLFHYGYVRQSERMLDKQNKIEKRYHPDGSTQVSKWDWDLEGTELYTGGHPEVMHERIKRFEDKYGK